MCLLRPYRTRDDKIRERAKPAVQAYLEERLSRESIAASASRTRAADVTAPTLKRFAELARSIISSCGALDEPPWRRCSRTYPNTRICGHRRESSSAATVGRLVDR